MHLFDWVHGVDLQQEIQEIYLHRFLFQLALGTVTIFLPLYLYELNVPITHVFLFFTVFYGVFLVAAWPVAHLAARIGYKHTSFLSSPFILGFYLVLRSLEAPGMVVYAAAVLGGVGFLIYWIGMNAEMARNSHEGHRDKETGYFFSVPYIASVVSPFIGGLIIAVYGFNVLFLFAAATIAASYAPFIFSREHYAGMETQPDTIFSWNHLNDFLTFYFRGVNSMGKKVVWPLYLAVVVTGALNIGGIGSVMALGGALVSIVLGAYVTPENRFRVLILGSVVMAASWLVMAFVTTPVQAFILSFINGLVYVVTGLPIYATVLENAEKEDIIEYFAFREISLCIGRVSILLAITAVFLYLPETQAFVAGFALIAFSAILAGIYGTRLQQG